MQMKVDVEKWRKEHRIWKHKKHLVHWGIKPGESIFGQCFKRILDPNRKCIPIMFRTNPNLYRRRYYHLPSFIVYTPTH